MTWYKKILIEKRAEVFLGTAVTLLFSLVTLIYHFATGQSFHWEAIDPIEAPSLFSYSFYSAVTFRTLGALLFTGMFYKFLYAPFKGKCKGAYREYKKIKALIWPILMVIMYYVVDVVIKGLNAIISIFYNLAALTLYLLPPLGITLIIATTFFLVRKNYALQPIPKPSDPLDSPV